ncbi:transglutaminase TgpA family protein [Protaetiibacter larvae]|uniref:Transglutaminase domain-containing protein n=1 Tax=Protaetiibacter larvae TaxID=2592654 RepID=A0A5C1YCK1_9MICO|nr:DUF3488 and transglutaminase-like domain-containing protein [Protaetiibacter larvae]QEO10617.1 transglutaminase domain-containing protein [Protaetiibacter larvae]
MALTELRRTSPAVGTPVRRSAARAPRRRPDAGHWRHAALLAVALLAALASLHVVLAESSWWIVGAGYTVLVLVGASAARSVFRRAFWAPIVALLVGIGGLTLGYAADTAILGVIPTFSTPGRFGELIEDGVQSIVEQRVPATPELGIVLLIAVLMIGAAWFAELCVAAEHPAYVAIPLAGILAIPMAVKPGLTDAFWFVVTAAAFLAILRIGRRQDTRRVTFLVGAIVVAGSLVVPSVFPPVREDPGPVRAGVATGINPLITLGDDLRRSDPVLALSYETTASEPVYLRLTTLSSFTGDTWSPSMTDPAAGDQDVTELMPPPGLTDAVARESATVDVQVSDIISRWLPAPYPSRGIEGLVGEWFADPASLVIRSTSSAARGQQYTATMLEVEPTAAQLAATSAATDAAGSSSLVLPDDLPEIIAQTAVEVAGQAGSAYDRAIALQSYLRSSPFEYSEDTPVEDGFDGSGLDALAVFLEKKIGYCVHYASAMAVMARVLGIPSRIAVGFQPGEREFDNGRTIYTVTSDDVHAWPELYFEGIGWLRFEPTPGRGSVPSYGEGPADDPRTPQDESTVAPTAVPTVAPGERLDIPDQQGGQAASAQQAGPAVPITLGVLAGLVLLVLAPAGFRSWLRWRRYRRIRGGPDPAAAAWEELRDTARDHGWSAAETETPREFADRLSPELAGGGAELGVLRGRVEVAAYGRPDAGGVSVAEVRAVRRSIARTSAPLERLRVFLLPPSLWARWRPDAR